MPEGKNQPTLPCRRSDVPFKEFGPAEGMLLDLESGEYFGLEGAAVAVWKLLDGRTSVEEIGARIARAQQAPEDVVQKDVRSFLRQLRQFELLAEPGAVEPQGRRTAAVGSVRRAKSEGKTSYLPPRLAKRGNLKFLGQLD